MVDSFGTALLVMRKAAGLSQAALAKRASLSKPHISHLETGERLPTADAAEAVDKALKAGGVLVELASYERGGGDDMRRRAILSTISAAASVGTLAGPHALADMVRHGLLDAAGAGEDWDAVVDDSKRRLVADPSPLFGAALLTNLMILRQQITEHTNRDLLRSAASLGTIYGLWLGNQSQLGGAHHWYRSAGTLADRSGDVDVRSWVRGRAAARGIYEGWTVQQTINTAGQALAATSRPTLGALEAHAAQMTVHALTGDVRQGRAAAGAMDRVAAALPAGGEDARARALAMRAFMECRFPGELDEAERVCDEAEAALAAWPTWLLETRVYRGRAMVAAGDVAGGLAYALAAVRELRHDVRVISVAVRDVCSAVPAGYRSPEYDELRRHAAAEPGPWETLR
jgi:transcriptional regulator with XRE-family HTH domain